jgi:hypothetical protein
MRRHRHPARKATLAIVFVAWGQGFFRYLLLAVLVLSMAAPASLQAQVVGGTLSGSVSDKSGAVIPQAQIVVTNTATGVAHNVTTNADGFYTAPDLLPGPYEVTISAPGFATLVRSGITLTVGAKQVLNLTLEVGKTEQQIQVVEEAPTVELASSSISAEVNSTTVRELPLNGRSWTDLANLQPGVDAIQTQSPFTQGANRGNRGFGSQITVSGARPQQNNYRLDGVSINDYANGASGSVMGGEMGVDAIQEFSVLTSNYSAEYGRTAGGVVNAITRSGTNQFHGTAYEFLRNSTLDARNFFDPAKIPQFRRNEFGASAGGPIRKDKLFIFGNYEGLRQAKGISSVSTVPSMAMRNGILGFSDASKFPSDCTQVDSTHCQVMVDPAAKQYLGFYPLPNPNGAPLSNGDTGRFTFSGKQIVREDFFTTRVDEKFSEKDSLSATYLYDDTPFTFPDSFDDVLLGSHTRRQTVAVEESHTVSSSIVNSVRVGFNRDRADNDTSVQAINPLAAQKSLGGSPRQNAAQVQMSGVSPFTGGLGGKPSGIWRWNSYQAYDDAFLNLGTHSLKFGVAVERMQTNGITYSDSTGLFSFGSRHAFLTNQPARFDSGFPQTLHPTGLRQTLFGAYVQDDWRLRPNLTVNVGLRYEMVTVPTEAQNRISLLTNITDTASHIGGPVYSNPTLRDFEPRIGLAWDPFHTGKTAVRGGFGIFDALPLEYEFHLGEAAPFNQFGSLSNPGKGSFYTGAFTSLAKLGPTVANETYIDPHPHRDYVMQWNLNIQQELTPSLAVMVGYIGSRGVHQPFKVDDANFVIPTLTPAGYLYPKVDVAGNLWDPTNNCIQTDPNANPGDPPICNPPRKINPKFGKISYITWSNNSFYHALQVGVHKKMSHGLQAQGSFTWGKSIDSNSATAYGDTFSNSISSLHWFDQRLSRGLSDFNIARTLVINVVWDVPAPKPISGPAAWVLNGWELGGIYTASDGVPFTATYGTDADPLNQLNSDPWAFPDRLTGPGCQTLTDPGNPNTYTKTQCFAVPTAPTPAFWAANCDPAPPTFGGPLPAGSLQCFNLLGNAGRNILIGPGTSNLDFSIFKNIPVKKISESFNVQFRAEFFNVLNRPNFAVPVTPDNTDIFDSTGSATGAAGLLTSTTTTSREIQFALKFAW